MINDVFFPYFFEWDYAKITKVRNKDDEHVRPTIGSSFRLNEDYYAFTYLY